MILVKLRLFVIIAKKSYNADSKSCGTSNLLAHVPKCPKNPYREDLTKGQKTLPFEPKKDGEDGFQLMSTTFSIEASRKALAEMIILMGCLLGVSRGMGLRNM